MLGETDDNIYLWTVLYYDIHGRVVQESHSSHRGGWQRTNTGYDFTDHPLKSQTVSNDTSAGSMTELYTYSYDAWGRPSTVTHKLDALSAVVLHNYEYDEAGRVISDARNGDADLKERYSYNVRSWKTDIKVGGNSQQGTLGETFKEKLYYNTQRPSNPQTTVQWGGNVSATDWMAGSDGVTRRYDFGYDGMSRLTGAAYADDNGGAGLYNRSYSYDRNSNITAVTSPSGTVQMSYVGNHLNGTNYDYDANGNLTKDLGRSIASIDYNQLNLPSSVAVNNGSLDGELLLYSASGVKLEAKDLYPFVLPGHTDNRPRTDYVGNLIYDKTSLKKVLVPGGYVEVSGTSRLYRFFVSDHLGGNRLVTDASGAILQTTHYDPYGQSLPAGAAADSGNPYKFGGKEYDAKATSYDFGARYYTTSTPQWTTMDPLCEKYYSISPYAYCAGNPVRFVDPDGAKIVGVNKRDAELAVSDLRAIFSDDVFANFRKLIVQSGKKADKRTLATISEDQVKEAFEGIQLNEDQKALVEIVVKTINSDDTHLIEYVNHNDVINPSTDAYFSAVIENEMPFIDLAATREAKGGIPASIFIQQGGDGVTTVTDKGTHSIIIIDGDHPYGREVTFGHEVFGHGRALALKRFDTHNDDAIQVENLIYRIMGIPYTNNGQNHADYHIVKNPSAIPSYR